MLEQLKAVLLTFVLTAWTTLALAQTPPSGSPPPGGTASPSGTTTSANPGDVAGSGLSWTWIILGIIVVAGLLFYFLGRGRNRT